MTAFSPWISAAFPSSGPCNPAKTAITAADNDGVMAFFIDTSFPSLDQRIVSREPFGQGGLRKYSVIIVPFASRAVSA